MKVKWFDPSSLLYGFFIMEGCSNDVFFHVNDVHSEQDKEGDNVTFIYNEKGKRGTDVKREHKSIDDSTSFLEQRIRQRAHENEISIYKQEQLQLQIDQRYRTIAELKNRLN